MLGVRLLLILALALALVCHGSDSYDDFFAPLPPLSAPRDIAKSVPIKQSPVRTERAPAVQRTSIPVASPSRAPAPVAVAEASEGRGAKNIFSPKMLDNFANRVLQSEDKEQVVDKKTKEKNKNTGVSASLPRVNFKFPALDLKFLEEHPFIVLCGAFKLANDVFVAATVMNGIIKNRQSIIESAKSGRWWKKTKRFIRKVNPFMESPDPNEDEDTMDGLYGNVGKGDNRKHISLGTLLELQKEQEECWRVLHSIYQGHTERLDKLESEQQQQQQLSLTPESSSSASSHSSESSESSQKRQRQSDDQAQQVEQAKQRVEEVSQKVGQLEKAMRAHAMQAQAKEAAARKITLENAKQEKEKEKRTNSAELKAESIKSQLSKEQLQAIASITQQEKALLELQKRVSEVEGEGGQQERAFRDLLQKHEEQVLTRLRTFGEDMKRMLLEIQSDDE